MSTFTKVIRIGDVATRMLCIDKELVAAFGKLVQDTNPIHFDETAALEAGFPSTICHGMLAASFFSGILAEEIPGPKSIYLSHNLRFTAPILVGDTIKVNVEVLQFRASKGLIKLKTVIEKTDTATNSKIVCVDGVAVAMNKTVVFDGVSDWSEASSEELLSS